jgi:hypothetical protein
VSKRANKGYETQIYSIKKMKTKTETEIKIKKPHIFFRLLLLELFVLIWVALILGLSWARVKF